MKNATKKILREKLLATPKRRDGKTRAKIAFNSSPFLEMLFILKSLSTVNLSYHIIFLYSNIKLNYSEMLLNRLRFI